MLNREDKKFLRGVFLKRAKKKIKAPISMKTDEKAQLVEMGGLSLLVSSWGVLLLPIFLLQIRMRINKV